jgi:hypothetical protein
MARNRVTYANEVLMISPSATGYQFLNGNTQTDNRRGESLLRQLKRIQNINYAFGIERQKVYQFGQLGCIDNVVIEAPTVSLDFTYLLTDGKNEHLMGFNNHDGSNFISADMALDRDGSNFYIYTTDQKDDAAVSATGHAARISAMESQPTGSKTVIALGNCYITNYSMNASVGSIPTVSVSAEGFNIKADTKSGAFSTSLSPGIDITGGTQSENEYSIPYQYVSSGDGVAAIQPGDIQVDLDDSVLFAGIGTTVEGNQSHIQSVSLDIPMSRTTIQRVGNAFGFSKSLDVPIRATVSVSAILANTLASAGGGSESLFTEMYANNKNNMTITMRKPSSVGAGKGDHAIVYNLKDVVLEGESYGMSIGDNRTVDLTFSASMANPAETNNIVSDSAYIGMRSTGVYEQIQVFSTGVSTDSLHHGTKGKNVAYGTAVAANKNFLVIGASGFSPAGCDGEEKGCAYIYKNKKGFYTQIMQTSGSSGELGGTLHEAGLTTGTFLLPTQNNAYDNNFGGAVAISNDQDLVAISMPNHTYDGAVAIYQPNAAKDKFTLNTVLADATDTIRYGDDIAFDKTISGDGRQMMVIGSPFSDNGGSGDIGKVFIAMGDINDGVNAFTETAIPYSAKTRSDISGPSAAAAHDGLPFTVGQRLGESVAMHKGVIVAGAPKNMALDWDYNVSTAGSFTTSGAAFVYVADAGAGNGAGHWNLYACLTGAAGHWGTTAGSGHNSAFGTDVDIFDNTIVVGAPSGTYNGIQGGAALVYTGVNSLDEELHAARKPKSWRYAATIVGNDTQAGDLFGHSVSMPNSGTIVVGAPHHDDGATNAGSIYVFTGDAATNWSQFQKINYSGSQVSDEHGRPETTLVATEKEIFFGGIGTTVSLPDTVIRYRI